MKTSQLEMPEIVKQLPIREEVALVPADQTPMAMIQVAVQQNYDIEKLEKLLALQERWEKNEARKAYVQAMSDFKAHAIQVVKDKTNSQYNSKYVSISSLVNTVTPFLSQHGLSARWDHEVADKIKVSCIVTHKAGHSESVSITFPPDKSGSKNPLQEVKSAITYGKICTFESICGLASVEGNADDDGNGAGDMPGLDDWLTAITDSSSFEEVDRHFKTAYAQAAAAKNDRAQKLLIATKDAKRGALRKAGTR